ncbi:MAG: hypothetical protein ACJ739_01610 [Acidimicrobiales bacterium]
MSSRTGPVVTPDGAAYLRMAQGRPPIEGPAGHFPGGYPFVLSLISQLGLTSLSAARWLGAGLAGVSVVLAGSITNRMAGPRWSLVVSVAFAVATPIVHMHTAVLSEPLFITLLLGWVLVMCPADRSRAAVAVGGAIAAAACLTRFAGVALLIATLLLLRRDRQQLWIFSIAAGVPLAVWGAAQVIWGAPTDRRVAWHPPSTALLGRGVSAVGGWVLGFPSPRPLGVAVAGLAAVLLWAARRLPGGQVLGIAAACYGVVLLVTTAFLDAQTPLDGRLLGPLHVLVLLAVPAVGSLRIRERAVGRVVVAPALGVALLVTARSTVDRVPSADPELLAVASAQTASATDALRGPFWSNSPSVIWLRSGAEARPLPKVEDPWTLEPNPDLQDELASLRQELARGGYLVWFDGFAYRDYLPTQAELVQALSVEPIATLEDGVVYQHRDAKVP